MSAHDPTVRDGALARSLVTPEGVDLNLRLADAGQRIGAVLIDLIILWLILLALQIVVVGAFMAAGVKQREYIYVIWTLIFFVLRNFWFIGFEMSPRAATPGKRLLGLRVAARNGGRLTAEAVLMRNVMREVELFLPLGALLGGAAAAGAVDGGLAISAILWTGIFLVFPLLNKDRLRAGDLLAGTWVVQNPRRRLIPDMADMSARAAFHFTDAQLKAYGIKELQVLEQVLRLRDRRTMAAVALRIRRKIDWVSQNETDAEFLIAYYAALRSHLEQRMLLGQRKKDKFDRS